MGNTGPKPRTIEQAKKIALNRLNKYAVDNNLKSLDDWYTVPLGDVYNKLSSTIKIAFGGDTISAIQELFRNETVYPFKFSMSPMGFWLEKNNRVSYVEWLGNELGYSDAEDWYLVKRDDFYNHFGSGLLVKHRILDLLIEAYPSYTWLPWRFNTVPNGFWKDRKNQRKFFDWILKQEGIKPTKETLSALQTNILKSYKGTASAFREYKNLPECIRILYPEIEFNALSFSHKGRGFWQKKVNQRSYLLELGAKLGFSKLEDWYLITERDFLEHKGISLLGFYESSPAKAVIKLLPEFDFIHERFIRTSKYESRLYGMLVCLFYDVDVMLRVRHPDLLFSKSGRRMELDVYVPELSLAIEYQGAQHYRIAWGDEETFAHLQQRDAEKKAACINANILLIEVPYDKWDGTVEGLLSIISEKFSVSNYVNDDFYIRLEEHGVMHEIEQDTAESNNKNTINRPKFNLSTSFILNLSDSFFVINGKWPKRNTGEAEGQQGLTWGIIDSSLRRGTNGLLGYSSLAQILFEERGVIHHLKRPKLRESLILEWAEKHYERTGKWPTHNSGKIPEVPGETWAKVRKALMNGYRGLKGGSSIEKLLWTKRQVRGQHAGNQLTYKIIIGYVMTHHDLCNKYPVSSSKWIIEKNKDSWQAIDMALRHGQRNLKQLEGGLSRLLEDSGLKRQRGKSYPSRKKLIEIINTYKNKHLKNKYPTKESGKIDGVLDMTWSAINEALKKGAIKGTPSQTLAQFLSSAGLK